MRKEIPEGGLISRWHGIAFRRWETMNAVTYPWGIHYLVRWARKAWYLSRRCTAKRWEQLLNNAYRLGWEDAMNQEYPPEDTRAFAEHQQQGP